jgi:hypothetical protein
MRKLTLLFLATFFVVNVFGQTVDANYLNPMNENSQYKHVRFGNEMDYCAAFMYNISGLTYGDGNDFTILTYSNRDLNFRTGTGNIIFSQLREATLG